MEAILGGVAFVGLFPALHALRTLWTRALGPFDSCAPLYTRRAARRPTTKTPFHSPLVQSARARHRAWTYQAGGPQDDGARPRSSRVRPKDG